MTEYWRPDSPQEREEMLDQCVKAAAIASLFNWLNGQAHCLGGKQELTISQICKFSGISISMPSLFPGHTQYTELAAPLTSQLILSDGQQNFWFAVAQLNTLAINIEVEGRLVSTAIIFIVSSIFLRLQQSQDQLLLRGRPLSPVRVVGAWEGWQCPISAQKVHQLEHSQLNLYRTML
jgi:hypothetical protein